MAAELMDFPDLYIVHRPGKHHDIADLMSRAEIEEDPETHEKMAMDMARWRMYAEARGPLPPCDPKRPIESDARIGEGIDERLYWTCDMAERALAGDETAYDTEQTQRYLQLMVRGATIHPSDDS